MYSKSSGGVSANRSATDSGCVANGRYQIWALNSGCKWSSDLESHQSSRHHQINLTENNASYALSNLVALMSPSKPAHMILHIFHPK